MKSIFLSIFLFISVLSARCQLQITPGVSAQALAERLVGNGVTVFNASYTGLPTMSGFFKNLGGTNIPIDSGIVLTTGLAATEIISIGVNNNGTGTAATTHADNGHNIAGDPDLAAAVGVPTGQMYDACVLEFDFMPTGDSIHFNYVFSSEEYIPIYVCNFNDAFAFFISGPGITGLRNIALVPSTTIPVSIFNVNNVPGGACPNNPAYYVDNLTNSYFTHDGHTIMFTAKERVQPCQTYHLKIVIADMTDPLVDSGVFLEARSLRSNPFTISNLTQTDPSSGSSYLVEGCARGAFEVVRQVATPDPQVVNLLYAGTATNGTDVLTLPTTVTIPANQRTVHVDVDPVMDLVPEGIEQLKIYVLSPCSATQYSDSTIIELRDYDILALQPDTMFICKHASVQLTASAGYTSYQWDTDPGLSNTTIANPVATPTTRESRYYCTAVVGTCQSRDSVFLKWKDMELLSKTDVHCRDASSGEIKVLGGYEWQLPKLFSRDGINWQTDSVFQHLPPGNYHIIMKDGICTDAMDFTIIQDFPDLLLPAVTPLPASCTGNPDGQITGAAAGGNGNYSYSLNGSAFQTTPTFNVLQGIYQLTVRDGNGCLANVQVVVPLNNTVTVNAGPDRQICEGRSTLLLASSNAVQFSWTPATTLSNGTVLNPAASPVVTTQYELTAVDGICSRSDQVTVQVLPAPVADAGPDAQYCYGKLFRLQGSGGVAYHWTPYRLLLADNSSATPQVRASSNTVFSLHVTDANGCRSLHPDQVTITVTPPVRIFAGNDTVAAINQPIQLNVRELSNTGVVHYQWQPAGYLNNPAVQNPVASLPQDTRFVVTATTADGCEGIDDINIKVYKGPEIYVPSGFTPNGDGLNDRVGPLPVGIKKFHFFRVFNRWGQLIFSTSDPARKWDGTIDGVLQPMGTFVWTAEATDFRGVLLTRKGIVTLIR